MLIQIAQLRQSRRKRSAVQTGTSNPSELPRDRDFGQLLTNPAPQPTAGNGSLLRTSANPLEAGSAPAMPGGTESDLTLMPVSYDRMALPDPDSPPQPSPFTPAPASLKATYSGEESLLDTNASETNSHRSPYSDIPSVYDIFAHSATATNSIERFGQEVFQNPTSASANDPHRFPGLAGLCRGPG